MAQFKVPPQDVADQPQTESLPSVALDWWHGFTDVSLLGGEQWELAISGSGNVKYF